MKWLENVKTRLDSSKNALAKHEDATESAAAGDRKNLLLLSRRERDVFNLLVRGMKLNDIAAQLGIQFSTVNSHTKSIYKKLGVNSRSMCIIRYVTDREKDVTHEMVSTAEQTNKPSSGTD